MLEKMVDRFCRALHALPRWVHVLAATAIVSSLVGPFIAIPAAAGMWLMAALAATDD